MPIPALALAAAPSIIKGISGLFGLFGGKKKAKNNIRPVQQVNSNYIKNVALAENMGRTGLPQEQYNMARQNIGRNQASALNTLSRGGASQSGVNSLLRASNDAVLGLDVQNANARLNNQRFAFGQRNQLAQAQDQAWDWNQRQRYLEVAQDAAQQQAAGRQNAFGSLTDLSMLGQQALASEQGSSYTPSQSNVPMGYNRMNVYQNGYLPPMGARYNPFTNRSERY